MNDTLEPELALQGGAPFYQQIEEQLRECIASGALHPGEELPTPRAVAVELAVNPNTVLKAYADLEREGYLSTEDGSGTFVAPRITNAFSDTKTWAELETLCLEWLSKVEQIGFSSEDIVRCIREISQRRSSS